MEISTYITSLSSTNEHPLLLEVMQHISLEERESYRQVFLYVTRMLTVNIHEDAEKNSFELGYLKRVIKTFSDEVEEQTRQRQILEAILRYAVNNYGMSAAKIPQVIKLQRDAPSLAPVVLLQARHAIDLYQKVQADLEYPSKFDDRNLEAGRLAAVLFLFEAVPSLDEVLDVITHFNLFYVGKEIFLSSTDPERDSSRFAIQLYTSLLFQLYQRSTEVLVTIGQGGKKQGSMLNKKLLLKSIEQYFCFITNNSTYKLSKADLINYRNIFWTIRCSPVEAKFYLQRSKSTLLPSSVLVRLLTNKACPQKLSGSSESNNELDPTNVQLLLRKLTSRSEQSHLAVKQAQQLVKDLVTFIKKPQQRKRTDNETDNKSVAEVDTLNAKELKNHHLIATSLISSKLQEPDYSTNFYVYLLGCWILDLLKNGGLRKSTLRLSTIRNYVAETSNKFLMVFSDINFLETDAEILTEKLNKVASIMPAKACGSLYYLALFIQKLDLVQDFFASDLEIKLGAGQVNANVVSVPQFELLAEYLYSKGSQYSDAILLMCMGFYTSMRRQEAKQIRISDFELLNISGRTDITVKVVPTEERNLKSRSGTRRIHLNAFWPTKWLELLADKVKLALAYGVSKSDLLFGHDSNQLFSFVSKLLRDYLRDEGFRYQNLRHSFVCWQFYRLVLQPKIIKTQHPIPAFIDHDYFCDAACIELRKHLGLAHNTRKSIYALCSLVGHSDPQTTFGSYLHLRDLYLRMLIADTVKLDQKALSRLVSRAKLDEQFTRDFPPGAISYVSLYGQETLGINPLPDLQEMSLLNMRQIKLDLPFNLPALYQIERSLAYIQTLRADDIVAVGDDKERIIVEGAWLTQLDRSCQYVQRYYPRRGRRLNLRPLMPKAKHQLRADKKISKSRVLFEDLRSFTQQALDSGKLDDASIIKGLEAFKGLLVAEELTIQFKNTIELISFLRVCKNILPPYIKAIATIYYPENNKGQTNTCEFLNSWSQALGEFNVEIRHSKFESISKTEYWSRHLEHGVVWLYFAYTDGESEQRASVTMHFIHFLVVACQTRLNLVSSVNER